ncbi:MAG: SurA N-terminal domain-containing protein [Sulfuricaulis sp.]|nr:SurA N-terminal domain-containing protein [Sulfuricaulis sp.]
MLSAIREKTQGIIATFIVALIAIPFALWGVNSYFDSGGQINVAKVNGIDITQNEYRNEIDRLRGRVEPKTLDNPQFKLSLLNNLIDHTLIIRDAEHQGYRVGNAQLAEIIRNQSNFQRDGKFDAGLYESLLRREGMNPKQFEARVRDEILVTHLQAGISESRVITRSEMAEIARLLSQMREVAYVVIGTESLIARVTVTPEDIEQYYSEHSEMFLIPEQVRVEYLRLSAADHNQSYRPTEEELNRAYAEEAARYVTPEKHRASHILIILPAQAGEEKTKEALARIQGIAKQARSGSDFTGLAKKLSEDTTTASQGGDLGEIRRGVLPKELEDAVYALKPGEVSQPVRSTYGYHLVKLTKHAPEKRKPLADVRQELVEIIRRRKGEEVFFGKSERLRNLVYEQPDSLIPAAKALGLDIQKSDWFTHAGGSGIAANPKVVQAAFEPEVLSQARNSDAIDISADTLVAIRVTDRRPAGRKPILEVRPQIERLLKQERALQQSREIGEGVLREVRDGGSLSTIAAKHGLKFKPPITISREQTDGVDSRIVEHAFRVPRPAGDKPVYDLVDLNKEGYALLAVNHVRDAASKGVVDAQKKIRAMLEVRRGGDYFNNYRSGLRQKADIKIHSDQL